MVLASSAASKLIPKSECEICGYEKNLVQHHPDYDFPYITVTVCRSCHMHIHYDIDPLTHAANWHNTPIKRFV